MCLLYIEQNVVKQQVLAIGAGEIQSIMGNHGSYKESIYFIAKCYKEKNK